nr:hypothetical protein [Tanacetum cinerariifolium]
LDFWFTHNSWHSNLPAEFFIAQSCSIDTNLDGLGWILVLTLIHGTLIDLVNSSLHKGVVLGGSNKKASKVCLKEKNEEKLVEDDNPRLDQFKNRGTWTTSVRNVASQRDGDVFDDEDGDDN